MLKNECRLYIAYIGQKEQNRIEYCFLMKTESAYKEKKLYILLYIAKKEKGAKGHKKRGTKNSPSNNPANVRLFGGFFGGLFACNACIICGLFRLQKD